MPELPFLIFPIKYATASACLPCFPAISWKLGLTILLSIPWQAVQAYLFSVAVTSALLRTAISGTGIGIGIGTGIFVTFLVAPLIITSRPCKIQIHDQSTIRRQTLCAIRRTNTHPTTHRRLYSHQNFAQRKPAKGFDPLCHNRSQ